MIELSQFNDNQIIAAIHGCHASVQSCILANDRDGVRVFAKRYLELAEELLKRDIWDRSVVIRVKRRRRRFCDRKIQSD